MKVQSLGMLVLVLLAACIGCDTNTRTSSSSRTGSTTIEGTKTSSKVTTESKKFTAEAEAAEEEVAAAKEGWGHLKGKFVYDGSAPAQSRLTITKDPDFCGQHNVVDESIVVNKENRGLANVVVYLYVRRGQDAPQSHESYAATADAPVVLDNDKCRFEPHVCVLRTSQTLVIKNTDSVGHNTNMATTSNTSFNQTIPSGSELEHHFTAAERRPATVGCNIHPWMKGWVLPLETPYFAVSTKDGAFEISNLPSGKWTFQVWHEKARAVSEVTIDGKATKWSKGRVEVTINADGTTDLGEIKVSEALFE